MRIVSSPLLVSEARFRVDGEVGKESDNNSGTVHQTRLMWKAVGVLSLVVIVLVAMQFRMKEDSGSQQNPVPEEPVAEIPVKQRSVAGLDPRQDGWSTEVFSESAQAQLKHLGEQLLSDESLRLSGLVADDFSGGQLRPEDCEIVMEDSHVQVRRSRSRDHDRKVHVQGRQAFEKALFDLRGALGREHVELKIFRVKPTSAGFLTSVKFHILHDTDNKVVQKNATWSCLWEQVSREAAPLLKEIWVDEYEEIWLQKNEQTKRMFLECTPFILGKNVSYQKQLLVGINEWGKRLQSVLGIGTEGHHGIAIGDVNGDGLDDLYVCQPGGLPNLLFIQGEDGAANEMGRDAGVDWLESSFSALVLDLDNDHDEDLVVATLQGVVLAENDGKARFRVRQVLESIHDPVLSAADYDNDGDLDIYVCSTHRITGDSAPPTPYHDANNGGKNILLENDQNWQFLDVTEEVGLEQNNRRFSLAASWEDYDNDGDQDLYVANDYGRNNLYRNDAGRFVDVASQAGVEDIAAGMSVSWADFNNDGWMDVYVSNMFSAAGNRIAYQRKFHPRAENTTRNQLQRLARGNSLFENAQDGTFRDVSVESSVTMGRWAWGSMMMDMNNDGWEDIVVANGFITGEDSGDL